MNRMTEKRINRLAQDLLIYSRSKTQRAGTVWHKAERFCKDDVESTSVEGYSLFDETDRWGGYDKHATFKIVISAPEAFTGKTVAFKVRTGREDDWDAVNPQFLAYVNGELRQGLDVNHTEILLTEFALENEQFCVVLDAYSGMLPALCDFACSISIVEKDVEKLYYDIIVPLQSLQILDSNHEQRFKMLNCLECAVNMLDLRRPDNDSFKRSVQQAQNHMDREFYHQFSGWSNITAVCVGHTHIDVAWLWTVAQTREKTIRSFSTVLELMKRYPSYIFMASQPQLYKYLKEDAPELYDKIKKMIIEKRWEAEGAMWLEADCNIVSGESLVRQILYGKRFFKKEFNIDSQILWLPDVFGYSAALPQIMKKAGVNYFMTTKLSWNEYNMIPYDTFLWEGIDGSSVLTHFITTVEPESEWGNADMFTSYNGRLVPECIKGAWDRYQQKDINDEILVSYGYGDGGGGPTCAHLEVAKRLEAGLPGIPKVKLGTATDFFKKLEKRVSGNQHIPKWAGELYLEFHRGTYTSMGRNKRYNRKSEFALTRCEFLSQMNRILAGGFYDSKTLEHCWELVLLNQFHDILPGSSIRQVYEDSRKDYEKVSADLEKVTANAIGSILSNLQIQQDSVVVFNTVGFVRNDVVEITGDGNPGDVVVCENDGQELPTQVTDDGMIFYATDIPSMGYKTFAVRPGRYSRENTLAAGHDFMSNGLIDVRLNENAEIISIFDISENREILQEGCRGNVLQAFEDKPAAHDAWDINIYYTEKMWEISQLESVSVIERGPVRACVEIKRQFLESSILQRIYLYMNSKRIDFKTVIDWKETHILLKTAFPVNIHSNKATYEIQYGNVERPTHWNTSWDYARFEVCAQKWADYSEGNYGVSLLNDCKYGHDIKDHVMRLTLIKSAKWPNETADREAHHFTYSLYPHQGGWEEAGTTREAYFLNSQPIAFYRHSQAGSLPGTLSFISVNRSNVILESVKKAEDDDCTVIRLYESENKRVKCRADLFPKLSAAYECDIMENKLAAVIVEDNGFCIDIKPYEIKTYLLAWQSDGPGRLAR